MASHRIISRPRFWLYVLGPFLIGAAAAHPHGDWWRLIVLGLFFTYPANLIIYGINDLFDYETDRLNPKKQGYEIAVQPAQQRRLAIECSVWVIVGVLLALLVGQTISVVVGMLGFMLLGIEYSAPPLRAKARPLIDTLCNALYIFPAVVSYGLLTRTYPQPLLFVTATLWCMAMHAFSAVPDIAADQQAGLSTIATWLGARGCLIFCGLCYLFAAGLSYPWLGVFSSVGGLLYFGIVIAAWLRPGRQQVFGLYRYFPYINMLVGMALFFDVALR